MPSRADDAIARGWALKEACYAAWSTAPREAVERAADLARLAARDPRPELAALADWTGGVAALIEGHAVEAVDRFDAACARFGAEGQAAHAAQTQVPKVVALSMLGRFDDALVCAEAALAQFVALGDDRSAGKIELNIGTMLTQRDRHAEAAAQYRRCAVRFARLKDVEHSVMADIGLANALTWLHDFDEALRVNSRARQRAEAHGFLVSCALAHGAIGRIELNRGRFDIALRELSAASRLLAQAGASPQRTLEAESALADAYLLVNLLPEAVRLYERVIEQATSMEAPVEAAWARLQRARAQERLGDLPQALEGLKAARDQFEGLQNAPSMALADLGIATVWLRQSTRGAAAEARRAARTLQAVGMTGWRLEAEAVHAAAIAAEGDNTAAEAAFRDLEQRGAGIAPILLAAQRGLGSLALARGDRAEARCRFDEALLTVARIRAALPGDGFRTAYSAEGERSHDLLVQIDADADASTLFATMERGRARALTIALREGASSIGPEAESARTVLRWLQRRRDAAVAEGEADTAAQLETDLALQEAKLLEAHRRDRLAGGAPVADVDADADMPPSAAAVQRLLGKDQAMLAFHRVNDRLMAVVVTRGAVVSHSLDATGLDARLEGVRFQIESLRFGGGSLSQHAGILATRIRKHLQALYQMVWAPLAETLAGVERVVVVPHRGLHYLPFCAMHDGAQWLVERHEITLAASAAAWLATAQGDAAPVYRRAVVLGHGGAALPHVANEVEAVARALGTADVRLLRGADAVQGTLRAAVADADVLHLACHGVFRADSPMFSALELADGPLAMHDVQSLALNGPLVTLSACETGLSRVAPGDELVGLVRAFLTAGARSVLATSWPVADASTASLMQGFYRLLAGGARPAAALRSVQCEFARAGDHPFHWAAFALHGRG